MGNILAVAYRGRNPACASLPRNMWFAKARPLPSPPTPEPPVRFSADSTRVALHSERGVMLHALPGGELIKRVSLPADALDFRSRTRQSHGLPARMAWARSWSFDYQTQAQIRSYPMPNYAQGLQWSPDGHSLGVTLRNGQIFVGDVHTPSTNSPSPGWQTARFSSPSVPMASGSPRSPATARRGSERAGRRPRPSPPCSMGSRRNSAPMASASPLRGPREWACGMWSSRAAAILHAARPGGLAPVQARATRNLARWKMDGLQPVAARTASRCGILSTRRLVASGVRAKGRTAGGCASRRTGDTPLTLGQDGSANVACPPHRWPPRLRRTRRDSTRSRRAGHRRRRAQRRWQTPARAGAAAGHGSTSRWIGTTRHADCHRL